MKPFPSALANSLIAPLCLALLLGACAVGAGPQASAPTLPPVVRTLPPTTETRPTETDAPTETLAPTPVVTATLVETLPPSSTWITYTVAETGLSLAYPDNWFIVDEPENGTISVVNVPPDSLASQDKTAGDLLQARISRQPLDIAPYLNLDAYLRDGPLAQLPEGSLKVYEIFRIQQGGYSAFRAIVQGPETSYTIHVTDGIRVGWVQTSVAPDGLETKLYLPVLDEIARRLRFGG